MNLKELRAKLNKVATDMSTLAQKPERTAEEETQLDALLAEFNDLAPQVERLASIEAASGRARELGGSAGRVAGAEALAAGDGGAARGAGGREIDRRSPGQRFADSDAVKEFIAGGFKGSSKKVELGAVSPHSPSMVYAGDGPVQRYTLIDTGDLPGYMIPPQVLPGIYRPRDYALTARDVLMGARTTTDTIYFLRELVFTNNAAETAEATSFDVTALGSNGRKPESALTFEEASAAVKTIAHWIPLTRQAIADAVQLQSYVENRLLVGLERRFNSQVWNGDGTGANLTGILNTSDIQELDDTYFGGDPVMNAGTDIENFDRALRAVTEVELTGDAMATFMAMNPRDIEKFQTVTDANKQYMGGGPFNAGGVSRLWSYPIARDRAIPEGTVIVGDGTMAAIWDREDANILIDTINDQFVRNMLTVLAEMRAALTVFRPAAFAVVTLRAWA